MPSMKAFLPFFLLLSASIQAIAQSTTGNLTALDAKAGTLTVSTGGAPGRLYRTRASVEVFINGAKSKFEELAEGMTVKVSSGEPGLAARIDASGTPKSGASAGGAQSLEQRLVGTKWLWWEGDKEIQTIEFKAGGRASWSIKGRGEFSWKVTPGENRIEGVAPPRGKKFKMTFNDTLTKGKIYVGEDRPRDTHVITN
jgi:hypothetical protein